MGDLRQELLRTYGQKKGTNRGHQKMSVEDIGGRKSASLGQVNSGLNGTHDRDHLFQKYLELYGAEELIPLDILLALFPEE